MQAWKKKKNLLQGPTASNSSRIETRPAPSGPSQSYTNKKHKKNASAESNEKEKLYLSDSVLSSESLDVIGWFRSEGLSQQQKDLRLTFRTSGEKEWERRRARAERKRQRSRMRKRSGSNFRDLRFFICFDLWLFCS